MATNEDEDKPEPTRAEVVKTFFGEAVSRATDTGPATGISLRVWVLIIVLGVVVISAPVPQQAIGMVALLALALSLASRVRGTRG